MLPVLTFPSPSPSPVCHLTLPLSSLLVLNPAGEGRPPKRAKVRDLELADKVAGGHASGVGLETTEIAKRERREQVENRKREKHRRQSTQAAHHRNSRSAKTQAQTVQHINNDIFK